MVNKKLGRYDAAVGGISSPPPLLFSVDVIVFVLLWLLLLIVSNAQVAHANGSLVF
jgi:hypothetical protein